MYNLKPYFLHTDSDSSFQQDPHGILTHVVMFVKFQPDTRVLHPALKLGNIHVAGSLPIDSDLIGQDVAGTTVFKRSHGDSNTQLR